MAIQVLPADVVNQIAAGEVVDRPAHLVKELIENSIDADATEIHIEIAQGGRFVSVSDNGSGILSTDLEKALQRHATSKISVSDDLWNLHSFGFRGEALASIAAVSNLSLESVHQSEQKPSQISAEFGKSLTVRDSSRKKGTVIRIEKLFENVPARLKFLKSDASESQQIKQILKAMALAHPEISFKLIQDGTLQLFYPIKKNLLERAMDILEKKELFHTALKKGNFEVEIVFSSPHEVAKTSKQIWIFAQNRFIQDRAIQAAVLDAYRSLLMHGEYPHAVIKLRCEPSEIDVNIHPTKSQVKFQDASAAFRCVHGALRQALEQAPWILRPDTNSAFHSSSPAQQPHFEERTSTQLEKNLGSYASISDEPRQQSWGVQDSSFRQTQFKQKDFDIQGLAQLRVEPVGYWSQLQVLGQAHLTYIICQKEDRIVFVDQHAAHERVVFESLMLAWKNKNFEVQDFLFPFVIDFSEDKVEAILSIEEQIQQLGIQIERLGPVSLGIKSAPTLIKDAALPKLFEKMASDLLDHGGSYAIEKKVSDLFATMACHSVVRAGQSLSHPQMQELLKSMDQFALSSFCPHGRPVSVDKTFQELEKLFGRIN